MRNPHRIALVALSAAAIALGLASCSTAPKPPEGVFEARNKAAELAKLGDGFMAKAQYAEALKYYEDALKADSAVDDLEGVSASHASMGRAYAAAGEAAAAGREYQAALDYGRYSASGPAQSTAEAGLGELAFAAGSAAEALAHFKAAAALASTPKGVATSASKEAADKALAVALHDEAVAELALGNSSLGFAELEKAQAMNLAAKRWVELGANRYTLASALMAAGRFPEAQAAALGALDADKRAENERAVPGDLAAVASLSLKMGKEAEAWAYWRRSFDSALSADEPSGVRAALTALVALAPKLDKAEEGARYAILLAQLDKAEGRAPTP